MRVLLLQGGRGGRRRGRGRCEGDAVEVINEALPSSTKRPVEGLKGGEGKGRLAHSKTEF